jgi:chaperonin cofactor prefoldin
VDNFPHMTEEQNDTRRLAIQALEIAREARVLAAGASQEVGDLKTKLQAHHQVLHALRETQLDHGTSLNRLERKVDDGFARVDERFEDVHREMNERFEQVDRRFGQVDRRFEQVDRRFEQLTAEMNRRFEQVTEEMNQRFTEIIALIRGTKS